MRSIPTVQVEQAEPTIRQDPGSKRAWREDTSIQGRKVQVQQVVRGERFKNGRTVEERGDVGLRAQSVAVVARSGNPKPASAGIDASGIEATVATGPRPAEVSGLGSLGPGSNAFTLALAAVAVALGVYALRK